MTQVFLFYTDGTAKTFPDPGNWNSAYNTVECVGAGGMGASAGNFSGGAGGGGAYAHTNNMSLTFPVPYVVGGSGLASNFGTNNANYTPTGNVVSAISGGSGSNSTGVGGNGGLNFYPSGFGGGAGGNSTSFSGGGGGAGGPHGAGAAGVAGTGSANGAGGTADGGIVPGGAASSPGHSGTTWDLSHGVGSGGGGGGGTSNGGANYGGGGGGSNNTSSPGGQGIIILTYLPKTMTRIFVYPYWPAVSVPPGGGGNPVARQFPNPGNWNPANNKIECVGMGGSGNGPVFGDIVGAMGSGGGGGGYSWDQNLNPTFPVPMQVVQGQTSPNSDSSASTWWNWVNDLSPPVPGVVIGGYGGAASGMVGQAGSTSPGWGGGTRFGNGSGNTSNYPQANGLVGAVGGQGASTPTNSGASAGGGGAGGPHGAGVSAAASTTTVSTAGGASDGGVTPGILGGSINGTQWDWLHGVGSGGSGGATNAGGLFGGAGGGAISSSTFPIGGGGLLVITYQPLPPALGGQAQIMA